MSTLVKVRTNTKNSETPPPPLVTNMSRTKLRWTPPPPPGTDKQQLVAKLRLQLLAWNPLDAIQYPFRLHFHSIRNSKMCVAIHSCIFDSEQCRVHSGCIDNLSRTCLECYSEPMQNSLKVASKFIYNSCRTNAQLVQDAVRTHSDITIDVGGLGGIPSIPPSPHVSILGHPSIPPS